jgi:hypothetical protein
MINSIDLTRLRSAEFIQFCKNFTSLVNTNNPTTLSLQPQYTTLLPVQTQYTTLLQKVTELETLFKTVTSNPITAEIETWELRRDRAITGIVGLVKYFSYHYDPTMVEAATVLQRNLDLYGTGITQGTYQSQTAIINNLISDWKSKPELKSAIDTLGILSWTSELKTVNETFDQKYPSRTQEYATATPDTLKSKRTEVTTAYYDLCKFMVAFSVIERSPLWTKTINECNALIEQYSLLLKGRTTTTKKTETVSPN